MTARIPEWTLGDRMGKSLRAAGISIAALADEFGVHRNTVSGWIHGRIKPDTRTVKLWAVTTNVPLEWLVGSDRKPVAVEVVIDTPAVTAPQLMSWVPR